MQLWSKPVVLKPVLGTPNHSIFCMSPSFNTPDSTHQLISRVCKTWNGCGLWERLTKCVVAGGPQDRFENHWSKLCPIQYYRFSTHIYTPHFLPLYFALFSSTNIWTLLNQDTFTWESNDWIKSPVTLCLKEENIFVKFKATVCSLCIFATLEPPTFKWVEFSVVNTIAVHVNLLLP